MSSLLQRQNPELFAQNELTRILNVDPSKKNRPELDIDVIKEIVRDYPKTFLVKSRYVYGDLARKLLPIFNLIALQAPADVVEGAFAAYPFSIMDELDSSAQSVVHYACRYHAPLETLQFLCMVNVTSLQLRDAKGYTPLHTAVSTQAPLDVIEYLVERNPDAVRIPDKTGCTPLHVACGESSSKASSLEVIQVLLNSQKKPENVVIMTNQDGWTALHVAAANDVELEVMEFLIETSPSVTELQTNPPVKEPKKERENPEDEDDDEDDDEEEEEDEDEEEPEGELALDIARNHKADPDVIRLLVKSTPGATLTVGERLAKSKRKPVDKKKSSSFGGDSAAATAAATDGNKTTKDKAVGVETARDDQNDDDEEQEEEHGGSSWFGCCSRRKHQTSEDDEDDGDDEEEEKEEDKDEEANDAEKVEHAKAVKS